MGAKVPQFRTLPREHLNYCQHLSALLVSDLVLRSIGLRQPKEHSPWGCQRRFCIIQPLKLFDGFEHLTLCISVQVADVCNWYLSTCITHVSKIFLRLICCCIIFHLLFVELEQNMFLLDFCMNTRWSIAMQLRYDKCK